MSCIQGSAALTKLGVRGDAALMLRAKAEAEGLLSPDGKPQRVRLAELVLVLDILEAAMPVPPPVARQPEPLVFTVPKAAADLVQPAQRLDLLVNDVIARARTTLHIGGPFWDDGGWELLRPVVLPALGHRKVTANFYLHRHESGKLDVVTSMLAEARLHGDVQALWWTGGRPSLMHAKFVVADRVRGYFGSANLTSLGLGEHLEMGVALEPEQTDALVGLLDALEASGLFSHQIPA
jgi:hypothetical protein